MAEFNPQTPFEVPSTINRSQGQIADRSIGGALSNTGNLIEMGVKATENYTSDKIQKDIYAALDKTNKEFGFTGLIDNASLPKGVQKSEESLRMLQAQFDQGIIDDTSYHLRLSNLMKSVRSKYPNWRPEIDSMVKSIVGYDPANAAINDLLSDLNSSSNSKDAYAKELRADIFTQGNNELMGTDPIAMSLYQNLQNNGFSDVQTLEKLHQRMLELNGEVGSFNQRKRRAEERNTNLQTDSQKATEFALDESIRIRRQVFDSATESMGGLDGFVELYEQYQEGGWTEEEKLAINSIVNNVDALMRSRVDELSSVQFATSEGNKSILSVIGADEMNRVKGQALADWDYMKERLFGKDNPLGPILYEKTMLDAEKNADLRRFFKEHPWARNLRAMKEAGVETTFLELALRNSKDPGGDIQKFYNAITSFLVSGYGPAQDSMSPDATLRMHENFPDASEVEKALTVESTLRDLGKVFKGEPISSNTDPVATAEWFFSQPPSQTLSSLNANDSSRLKALEMLASPEATQWAYKNLRGTALENYKTFVLDSFALLPEIRRDLNNARSDINQNVDRLTFNFDPQSFQFSVEDAPGGQGWSDLHGIIERVQRDLNHVNRYLNVIKPIVEQEGTDGVQFLKRFFGTYRIPDTGFLKGLDDSLGNAEETEGGTDNKEKKTSSLSTEAKAISDIISIPEGTSGSNGYNTFFANGETDENSPAFGRELTGMTVDDVIELQSDLVPYNKKTHGYNTSAAGKYQIVGRTLRDLKRTQGLTGDEIFDEDLQDKLFLALLERRGYGKLKAGEIDEIEFINNLKKEWEGVSKSWQSRYDLLELLRPQE